MATLVRQSTVTRAPAHDKPYSPRVISHVFTGDTWRHLLSGTKTLHYFRAVPTFPVIILHPVSQLCIIPKRIDAAEQLPPNPSTHALPR